MRPTTALLVSVGLLVAPISGTLVSARAQKPVSDPAKGAKADASKTAPAAPLAIKPGKDRWLVKTGQDPDAASVNQTPAKTTLEDLLNLPRPVDLPLKDSSPTMQAHRAQPVETTVYSIEADVVQCQLMPDGDYKVTLRGATGKTMVMEMPNPAPDFVDPHSLFADRIRSARVAFDSRFQPERVVKTLNGHARITGIGYFGRAYGDKPVEGNLIQLHPVLKVEWLAKPTAEFAAPKPSNTPAAESKSKKGDKAS